VPKAIWDTVKVKNSFWSSKGEHDLDRFGLQTNVEMRVTFEVLFTGEFSFRSLWKSRSAQRKDNLVCPRFAAAHRNGPRERLKNNILVLTVECHGERKLNGRSGDTRKRCSFARTAADRIVGTLTSAAALLVLLAAAARTRLIALDR
jgi:hypothetical protein